MSMAISTPPEGEGHVDEEAVEAPIGFIDGIEVIPVLIVIAEQPCFSGTAIDGVEVPEIHRLIGTIIGFKIVRIGPFIY